MATPHGEHSGRQTVSGSPSPHRDTQSADKYAGFPADLRPGFGEHSQPPSQAPGVEAELRSLLQALPTKADIAALIAMVEAAHHKEMNVVRADVSALTTRRVRGEFPSGIGMPNVGGGGHKQKHYKTSSYA